MKIPALKKFDQISDKARENIYALVMKHYQKHPGSPWSGRYLVELENSIKKFYQEMGAQYQGAFRDTLPDMMKEFYDRAKEEIKTAGTYKAIKGEPDAKRIKYFLDNSFEQVAMRTDKMSFDHIRSLRQLSAEVFREMAVTGHTRREVSKALFERAMKIPGFEFTDKAGSKWQAKSYFKMLARTELMSASRECYDDKMSEEGFDVMRLTVSGEPCDSCAKYENRLFSLTGATAGLPTKADLEAAGVFHPNCTHTYVLVPDYIRLRDYNPDGTKKDKSASQIVSDGRAETQYRAKETGSRVSEHKNFKKESEHKGGEFKKSSMFFDDDASSVRSHRQEYVVRSYFKEIFEIARKHKLTIDEYLYLANQRLQRIIDSANIFVRVPSNILDDILQSGRFKSQFETNTSGSALNKKARAISEYNIFGFGAQKNLLEIDFSDKHSLAVNNSIITAPRERPIYGFLDTSTTPENRGTGVYGDLIIKLKPSVKERTTYTYGDSLGTDYCCCELKKANALINPEFDFLTCDEKKVPGVPYGEAQVHGGVKISDIAEILIDTGDVEYFDEMYSNIRSRGDYISITKRLDLLGIPYRFVKTKQ